MKSLKSKIKMRQWSLKIKGNHTKGNKVVLIYIWKTAEREENTEREGKRMRKN